MKFLTFSPRCCANLGIERPSLGLGSVLLLSLLLLTACSAPNVANRSQDTQAAPDGAPPSSAEGGNTENWAESLSQYENGVVEGEAIAQEDGFVKVGMLLPLSGQHRQVGQALLNASQVALFDLGGENFKLVVQDTAGTPEGAASAAQAAVTAGVDLIIGPLFSTSVEAVKPVVQAAEIKVLAFSSNRNVGGDGVYVMGLSPHLQVERIVAYAASQGLRQFGVLAPETPYGQAVAQAMRNAVDRNGSILNRVVFYDPASPDLSPEVRSLANYDGRQSSLNARKQALEAAGDAASRRALARLRGIETVGTLEFDAILLAGTAQQALSLAPLLAYYDVDPNVVRFLGTALWDGTNLGAEPSLKGSWFAAPAPEYWTAFKTRYAETFGSSPPRVASLAYDATALAAVLTAQATERGLDPVFDDITFTQASGFAGIDGIFRFYANGESDRGLAVLAIEREAPQVIDPAPGSFENLIN
ncbi:penicillin-binding protein activator [Pelagibius sp. Alg239-R121]|uniref:penicillin-binding protein activator n=1 Tax=Pelagibius sp. Alg239-R121 TaxID=2993448 RepID=UPI0024A71C87|nr:penicillin-binding protein activator [Pelagibius sp. Alg239-R121]